MKYLEDYLMKTGTPSEIAMADLMKPILKKADGVLEDAFEYEAAKEGRRKSRTKTSEASIEPRINTDGHG